MANVSNATVTLHNGHKMPLIGLGTWQSPKGQVKQAVIDALAAGYRHIDCAYAYQNEDEVGEAIKESIAAGVLKREELFVTSKLWLTFYSRERVEKCLQRTLKALQLDYLDLYLVHWPMGFADDDERIFPDDADGNMLHNETVSFEETWLGMQDVHAKGLAKSIGISNFTIEQIERLNKVLTVKPAVNQIELHPYLVQKELVDYCKKNGIVITAYSPLGSTPPADGHQASVVPLMQNEVVKKIAAKHGKSAAQVLIKYHVQRDVVVIPKSVTKERIVANAQVFDFQLTAADLDELNSLNCDFRVCHFDIKGNGKHRDYPFKK